MTWTKLSDDHFDQEPIFQLSRSARLLDIEATVWCNRVLNGGRLPKAMLARFATYVGVEDDAAECSAEPGPWTDDGDVWQLDWTHQETVEQIKARKEAATERQRTLKERRAACKRGDHSDCFVRTCPYLQTLTRESRVPSPSRPEPDPTRPEGLGEGRRGPAPAEIPAPLQLEPSPEQEAPNAPVPDDEIADPYELVGDCLKHNYKGGLDRRIVGGQVRCPTCRREAKADAELERRRLRVAEQLEESRAGIKASENRLKGLDDEAKVEAESLRLRSVEQDDEEIKSRRDAFMNGEVVP